MPNKKNLKIKAKKKTKNCDKTLSVTKPKTKLWQKTNCEIVFWQKNMTTQHNFCKLARLGNWCEKYL